MRILLLLIAVLGQAGCTAMLVGGSATAPQTDECQETENEENRRECK